MTDPYFELPKKYPGYSYHQPGAHVSVYNPYAVTVKPHESYSVTKPTVKPHESKSLNVPEKAHPEPQEVKSLPEIIPTSAPLIQTTTTPFVRLPKIVTTHAPKIKHHGEPTLPPLTFDQFKSNYFGSLKTEGLKRPPTVPTKPPPTATPGKLVVLSTTYVLIL